MNRPETGTNRQFGGLGDAQNLGAQVDITPSPSEFGFVFEDDFVFAMKPGEKLVNEIEANERRAVDADEEPGVERVLEIFEGTAKCVSLRTTMEKNVVGVGLDPENFRNGDKESTGIGFDENAIGKGTLLLQRLQHFG